MTPEELAKLNLVELLDQLIPPPEPPAISMWPATEGWIWLGLAILIGLGLAIRWLVKRHRANAYRRAALSELKAAGDDPAAIAEILRRAALAAYPRAEVASVQGDDWLRFLDQSYEGKGFSSDMGRAMVEAPYRTEVAAVAGLSDLAHAWVNKHKVAE